MKHEKSTTGKTYSMEKVQLVKSRQLKRVQHEMIATRQKPNVKEWDMKNCNLGKKAFFLIFSSK